MSLADNGIQKGLGMIKCSSIPVWIWFLAAVAITLPLFYVKVRALRHKRLSRRVDNILHHASSAACNTFASSKLDVKNARDFTEKHQHENDLEKGTYAIARCSVDQPSVPTTQSDENEHHPSLPSPFKLQKLASGFSGITQRVNCCKPFDNGKSLAIGTDRGVFIKRNNNEDPPLHMPDRNFLTHVTQIEILEQHDLLIALADGIVYTFPLNALRRTEGEGPLPPTLGRKISHASHFKAGTCMNKQLLCCIKSSSLSATAKLLEPRTTTDEETPSPYLTPYKEFYVPSPCNSVHFLRSKLCIATPTNFLSTSLETLETEPLLDEADSALSFAHHEPTSKPVYITRKGKDFLLCYQDYAFYVNKNGWRARGDWKVEWEGSPYAFTMLGDGYIVAFWAGVIEVRSSESGELVGALTERNIRFLHQSSNEILFAYADELERDVIASLSL